MPKIGPGRTFNELKQSAVRARQGTGHPALPGVKTDAFRYRDQYQDFKKNRELMQRIGEAMMELKGEAHGKPKFVIGWRLYPNRDNEYWQDRLVDHVCSCACSCACIIGPDPGNGPAGQSSSD